MKKYSMIHIPVLSFYWRALYRDVALEWKGTCFAYLLLLLAVCWIPPIVEFHRNFADFVKNDAPRVVSQIPQITIVNGVVTAAVPQPYFIRDPDTQKFIIIDTTGTYSSLKDTGASGLLTGTDLIIKKSDVETRTFNLKEVEQFSVNSQKVTHWLETARRFAAPVFYPFAVMGSFLFRVAQVLIYALLGMLLAALCRTSLPYLSLVRLSVVAITPCIIAATVLGAFNVTVPFAGLLYFLAAMTYLFFGVQATAIDTSGSKNSGPPPLSKEG